MQITLSAVLKTVIYPLHTQVIHTIHSLSTACSGFYTHQDKPAQRINNLNNKVNTLNAAMLAAQMPTNQRYCFMVFPSMIIAIHHFAAEHIIRPCGIAQGNRQDEQSAQNHEALAL